MNQLGNRIETETIPIVPRKSEEEIEENTLRKYNEIREQRDVNYKILIG
ncbi:MAG: hypothetical protein Q7R52_05380 [archaeon]|nr:hypothetical protein [archaeon]